MKTIELTTISSVSHRRSEAAYWLSTRNSFLSVLLGCTISNLAAAGCVLFNLLMFLAIILVSDANAAYGWAAFCALAAINAILPLVHEFKKGGK